MWFAVPPGGGLVDLTKTGDGVARFKTTRAVRDFVLGRYPDATFVLSTMAHFLGDTWPNGPMVAMAVCERSLVATHVPVHGFVIGGLVSSASEIPAGHGPDAGCIPFDLSIWPGYFMDLPPSRN